MREGRRNSFGGGREERRRGEAPDLYPGTGGEAVRYGAGLVAERAASGSHVVQWREFSAAAHNTSLIRGRVTDGWKGTVGGACGSQGLGGGKRRQGSRRPGVGRPSLRFGCGLRRGRAVATRGGGRYERGT